MSGRLRILVVAGAASQARAMLSLSSEAADWVEVFDWTQALKRLRTDTFDAIFLDPSSRNPCERTHALLLSEEILDTLADGVAVVSLDLRVLWSNRTLERWAGGPVRGRQFYEVLGSTAISEPGGGLIHTALIGQTITKHLQRADGHVLELHITPLVNAVGPSDRLLAICRDVTAEVHHQQLLKALHEAGRELAGLTPEFLGDLRPEERLELLKQNILRFTDALLHYNVIEIRLLDRRTGRLDPLLSKGIAPEDADRRLTASPENNGITGYVAHTGKAFLCPDTSAEASYIEGARGMRSSLTVPLLDHEEVVGTFNVESPEVNAFDERDVYFAEIFSKEIADALHTLDLLSAEKRGASSYAVEAIRSEVALPVDDILTSAAAVLDRYIGHDAEMADRLREILRSARQIKRAIQKIGEDLAPPSKEIASDASPVPFLKGVRVLVADNEDRVRRSAHDILGRWGCIVETARDGKEALTMARLSSYDAIVADIRLPDLTGYEAFCQFRQSQPHARIILMTGYGYDASHSMVKARQEGLAHVLFKPFRIDQLREALSGVTPGVAPSETLSDPDIRT